MKYLQDQDHHKPAGPYPVKFILPQSFSHTDLLF